VPRFRPGITARREKLTMLLPHGATVLALDGGRMRLFRNRGQPTRIDLETLDAAELDNPRTHVLGARPPGRSFESGSPSRSAHETTDRHQQREDRFCRGALDTALAAVGDGGDLVLIAPPRVLGDLREHCRHHPAKVTMHEIGKDLTALTPPELGVWLRDHH
jgi:protein required for attachment to host cells